MDTIDIITIIVLSLIAVGAILPIFFAMRKKRHRAFVEKNSKALKELEELNRKYHFFDISSRNATHIYDNAKFFNDISCEDYLIYQLQFRQHEIREEMYRVERNGLEFAKYTKELAEINSFGEFLKPIAKLNVKLLNSIEAEIFKKNTKSPVVDYKIRVTLYLSKINGSIYSRKAEIFGAKQINEYIRRLNNKRGAFYSDRGIWDSICRVERGKVSNKMRFSIYKRDGYRCRYCGRTERSDYLEIDHIKPIAKGGKTTYENLQTLCRRCNKEKGDKY